MKHRVNVRKLGRTAEHRWAMLRTMVTQLITHDRIATTMPKAKELRRVADQMVTLGKRRSLHAWRQAGAVVRCEKAVFKLFTELADRYQDRQGGYTRVMKLENRSNDNAPMAWIEFVDRKGEIRPARPPRPSLLPQIAQMTAAMDAVSIDNHSSDAVPKTES